ncbi:MAG: GNAT family N-acetyltransferase [Clostridiales bacterium]|nr:GNAT family N-acetyltransferase [Clostridiales bacterium]
MEVVIKRFDELTVYELYEIFKLRVSVFVVEQNCPYQEITEEDKESYHCYFKDSSGVIAYLRVVPKGVKHAEVSLGRVISVHRRKGLGSKLLAVGIEVAKQKFLANTITVEAQSYAKAFYEKSGFKQTSKEFLLDGIPHIMMQLNCNN